MFVKLFRLLKGYLIIKITGENIELLLNSAAKNGIKIWNLFCKRQNITGCISIWDFKKLKHIKRYKTKIKIIKKYGLPFWLYKYKKRSGILVGIVIFLIIIKMLSMYIWNINVVGCKNIKTKEILSSCEELSIKQGINKSKIEPHIDAQRLLLLRNDIAWASLNIEGCVLTVNITEIEEGKKDENQYPCNLKASYDGIIRKIDVTSGNTIVKVGDVVNTGDVLVSGILERNTSTVFVPSCGKILANTQRAITKEAKFKTKEMFPNGIVKNRKMISFFNLNIPLYLGNIKKDNILTVTENTLKLFKKQIPIKLYSSKHKFTKETQIIKSKDELVEILSKEIDDEIKKMELEEYTQTDISIFENENGIKVTKYFDCIENIAYQDKIIVNTVN